MRVQKAGEVRVCRCRNRAIQWPASVTGLGEMPRAGCMVGRRELGLSTVPTGISVLGRGKPGGSTSMFVPELSLNP